MTGGHKHSTGGCRNEILKAWSDFWCDWKEFFEGDNLDRGFKMSRGLGCDSRSAEGECKVSVAKCGRSEESGGSGERLGTTGGCKGCAWSPGGAVSLGQWGGADPKLGTSGGAYPGISNHFEGAKCTNMAWWECNISNSFSKCAMWSEWVRELISDEGMYGNASKLGTEEMWCAGFAMTSWGFISGAWSVLRMVTILSLRSLMITLTLGWTGLSGIKVEGTGDTNGAEIESGECGGLEMEGLVT